MTPLARALAERIRSDGPLSVEAYMEACNAFYYATRDPLGVAGDFTTAPEIHQMFGEMVGACLADCWHRAGAPNDVAYVELGPGRGTLATDALRAMAKAGLRPEIHFVEASSILREIQWEAHNDAEFHTSLLTIPADRPLLIVANEFFDALPVRQWVGDEERRITIDGGQLAFLSNGLIHEDSPARDAYAWEIAAQLDVRGGAALIIDYGHLHRAPGDTLQAVKGHRFADPLANPGDQDLTSHVDFEALQRATAEIPIRFAGPATQSDWLNRIGIAQRAETLVRANPDRAKDIDLALERLTAPGQMGDLFKVVALHHPDWPAPAGFE